MTIENRQKAVEIVQQATSKPGRHFDLKDITKTTGCGTTACFVGWLAHEEAFGLSLDETDCVEYAGGRAYRNGYLPHLLEVFDIPREDFELVFGFDDRDETCAFFEAESIHDITLEEVANAFLDAPRASEALA